MDELREKLAALGIEADKMDEVIETVLGFIKNKLPDGMEGM
ncbi:MAG: SOS response regulatory protein OraA/RecX, partial [Akkermansiaceae bacterium]